MANVVQIIVNMSAQGVKTGVAQAQQALGQLGTSVRNLSNQFGTMYTTISTQANRAANAIIAANNRVRTALGRGTGSSRGGGGGSLLDFGIGFAGGVAGSIITTTVSRLVRNLT